MAAPPCRSILIVLSLLLLVTLSQVAEIASRSVLTDARRHRTRSHACSSARNAAPSVYAFLLVRTAIRNRALAITTGRRRKEDRNALEEAICL
ncbi:gibberellin-regulated protein 5 isoform X2 [Senna tora]|uniref:Gibberellin-regulated protein 5 isoform X2 n=1 Tax=Senna tora TaxID=362788 RepID=A0A834TZR1_9FABA|nr:gibberellin-regulated protein 5 isoform X2 [Senna tora]